MIAAMRMHAVTDQMTIAWAAPKMARRSPAASTLDSSRMRRRACATARSWLRGSSASGDE
jgi:hypothetical protein